MTMIDSHIVTLAKPTPQTKVPLRYADKISPIWRMLCERCGLYYNNRKNALRFRFKREQMLITKIVNKFHRIYLLLLLRSAIYRWQRIIGRLITEWEGCSFEHTVLFIFVLTIMVLLFVGTFCIFIDY